MRHLILARLGQKATCPVHGWAHILLLIVEPLSHFTFFALLARSFLPADGVRFVILGNALYFVAQRCLFNILSLFRYEKRFGTLPLNIIAPQRFVRFLLVRSFFPMLEGLLVAAVCMVMASLIFQVSIPLDRLGHLSIALMILVISMTCSSLIIGAFGLIMENANMMLNLVLGFLQIGSGVNFPIDRLPAAAACVAEYLPLTHALLGVRSLLNLENTGVFWAEMWRELLLAFCYLGIALLCFGWMERLSRRRGSLFYET